MNKLSDVEAEYVKQLYAAEVESVDERVGFIIETLRHQKLLDDTYIIFTTDHGEMFGEHGQWGHRAYYYDVLMRIPLIIAGPGVSKGSRAIDRVSLVDLMPTLREALDVDYTHEMQGESFLPLLSGGRRESDSVYITSIRRRKRANDTMHRDALIAGEFKLITIGDDEFELYNLLGDPAENNDLAADQRGLVRSMYESIKMQRAANEILRARNTSEAADTSGQLTDKEAEETNKKLRALGYIK
jgi:choline-sulfatase